MTLPLFDGPPVAPPPSVGSVRDDLIRVARYVGEQNVPQDVKRRRRQVYDAMRRLGTPVVIKHMFNDDDVELGLAETSPNWQDPYGQVRNEDPYSFGIGLVSKEKSLDEWITPSTGKIVQSDTQPDPAYLPAPRYRGFGPGYITYIIEPDVAEDIFKLTSGGALIRASTATVQAPWFPPINDNDLVINVVLDGQGRVTETLERYQAKQVNPISIRGLDRRGRREGAAADGGNRFVVNQSFQATLIPSTNILMSADVDR